MNSLRTLIIIFDLKSMSFMYFFLYVHSGGWSYVVHGLCHNTYCTFVAGALIFQLAGAWRAPEVQEFVSIGQVVWLASINVASRR